MTTAERVALFKCLADKSRLEILESLAASPMYVEQLANRLGITPPTVSFHLKKLEASGLVQAQKEQYYTVYSLQEDLLKQTMMNVLLSGSQSLLDEREGAYRQGVIKAFMKYGKLESIPVQRKKRLIILQELVKNFEMNRTYTEKEVNLILADFNDDFCTLRREMIANQLMTREKNIYTRL
jgi:Uncharacterized protein conserved in bacteria